MGDPLKHTAANELTKEKERRVASQVGRWNGFLFSQWLLEGGACNPQQTARQKRRIPTSLQNRTSSLANCVRARFCHRHHRVSMPCREAGKRGAGIFVLHTGSFVSESRQSMPDTFTEGQRRCLTGRAGQSAPPLFDNPTSLSAWLRGLKDIFRGIANPTVFFPCCLMADATALTASHQGATSMPKLSHVTATRSTETSRLGDTHP